MIVTLVHIPLPQPLSLSEATEAFQASAPKYQQKEGLIRKYYSLTEDGSTVIGIYLWHDKSAAEACLNDDWRHFIEGKYGRSPKVSWLQCPVLVDNLTGEILTHTDGSDDVSR